MCSQRRRSTAKPVSLRAFARAQGVTLRAVQSAVKNGRVNVDDRGRIPDARKAAEQWKNRTLHTRRPVSAGADGKERSAFTRVSTALMQARLVKQQLENERFRGGLVDAEAVRIGWTDLIVRSRTKLLAIASKAKLAIPHLSHADLLVLDGLVREALEDLADDDSPPVRRRQGAASVNRAIELENR